LYPQRYQRTVFCLFQSVLTAILLSFSMAGCSSTPKTAEKAPSSSSSRPDAGPHSVDQVIQASSKNSDAISDREIETEILELEKSEDSANADPSAVLDDESEEPEETDEPKTRVRKAPHHPIAHEFNQKVAEWVRYFSQKDRERFQRYLDRGESYREVVEEILEENRVPADLFYLGLIESGFNLQAKSSAKAMGVWQFMKSTGKMYGLSVDPYVDERKDPIRATEAAARHLRDLYREFGSWPLALAAYNAGSGRIRGAIRRAKTRDFWEMVERKKLPRETMEYVPKFLAARYIGERPDLFAFYINEERRYPNVVLVKVPSPVRFETIEQRCKIPNGTLEFVNPHYQKSHTHPLRKVDEIWVPEEYKAAVNEQFATLMADRIKIVPDRRVVVTQKRAQTVVVKRGQNLQMIARNQGLSVAYLKRLNGLSSSKIIPGQRLKVAATEYRKQRNHPRGSKNKRKNR